MTRGRSRADVWIAAGAAAAVAAFAGLAVYRLDPRFLDPAQGADTWFEADLPRIADEITHRWAPHSRAPVHPLFSLFAVLFVYALRACRVPPLAAIAAFVAVGAGAWTALMYAALRLLRLGRVDALLFTTLGAFSAAGLFWLTVPETYVFGSATMLFAAVVAGLSERLPVREGWFVLASGASLSVTLSNWIAGIAAAFAARPRHRAAQITVNAFAAVVVLWGAQRLVVPHADFFIGYSQEQRYLLRPEAGGLLSTARVLLMDAMVMPRAATALKRGRPIMTVQRAPTWTPDRRRAAALALWIVLLCAGATRIPAEFRRSRVALVAVVTLAGELLLHLVYGTETFLYTLNVVPWLVIVAAFSVRTQHRRAMRAVACALAILGGTANLSEWRRARDFFDQAPTPVSPVGRARFGIGNSIDVLSR